MSMLWSARKTMQEKQYKKKKEKQAKKKEAKPGSRTQAGAHLRCTCSGAPAVHQVASVGGSKPPYSQEPLQNLWSLFTAPRLPCVRRGAAAGCSWRQLDVEAADRRGTTRNGFYGQCFIYLCVVFVCVGICLRKHQVLQICPQIAHKSLHALCVVSDDSGLCVDDLPPIMVKV